MIYYPKFLLFFSSLLIVGLDTTITMFARPRPPIPVAPKLGTDFSVSAESIALVRLFKGEDR